MKVGLLIVVLTPLLASSNALADAVSAEEVAKRMGLSAAAIDRVKAGEVVAEELEATSDKDLSLAVVMRLDASLDEIFEFVDSDRLAEIQTVTISSGAIDPNDPSLAEMSLPDDVLRKLASDPADAMFMSIEEAQRVGAAAKRGAAEVLDAYRAVLAARASAYWENGLSGISPYAGKGRSPAVDLGHANEAARSLVNRPAFLAELEAAPSQSAGKANHKLKWAVEKGRDQAAPILIHEILYREDEAEIFVQRRFYSGYDYDALQIVVGVLPTRRGWSAVFYTNHTYTAQVAGFGGGTKRSIGRKILQKEVVAQLQRAQAAIPRR